VNCDTHSTPLRGATRGPPPVWGGPPRRARLRTPDGEDRDVRQLRCSQRTATQPVTSHGLCSLPQGWMIGWMEDEFWVHGGWMEDEFWVHGPPASSSVHSSIHPLIQTCTLAPLPQHGPPQMHATSQMPRMCAALGRGRPVGRLISQLRNCGLHSTPLPTATCGPPLAWEPPWPPPPHKPGGEARDVCGPRREGAARWMDITVT